MIFRSEPNYIGYDTYDVVDQRVVSTHITFGKDRTPRVFETPQRYIWPAEMDLMAQLAGFRLEAAVCGLARQSLYGGVTLAHLGVPARTVSTGAIDWGTE